MLMLEVRSTVLGFSGHYSEGVASIAAVIKQAGHDFELLHVTRPVRPETLARRVAKTRPDVIGYSCMTHTFSYLKKFAAAIKRELPTVPTVLGGVHANLNPEQSLAARGIDAVCRGEGETVVLPLMERVGRGQSFVDLDGLWVRDGDTIHRNPTLPMVTDLDSLPMPDRGIFDNARLVSTREGVLYIHASRGCPYVCPFCSNVAIRAAFPNSKKYLRYKSVSRVCQEIETAVRGFPGKLQGIYFQDEILTINTNWLAEFAEVYPKRIGIPFNCNMRGDGVTERVADRLKQAGCNSVSIGLESGNERIREAVVGKNISDATFRQAFRRLGDRGINVNTFSMIGLPGETPEEALQTVFFNAESEVDKVMFSIFCPYPGTPLHERALADGILTERFPDTFQDDSPLRQESISSRQVRFIHDFFDEATIITRSRWGGWFKPLLTRYVLRDGFSMGVLSRIKRTARLLLSAPYLAFGHLLYNRQARVFGRCGPVAVDSASKDVGRPAV